MDDYSNVGVKYQRRQRSFQDLTVYRDAKDDYSDVDMKHQHRQNSFQDPSPCKDTSVRRSSDMCAPSGDVSRASTAACETPGTSSMHVAAGLRRGTDSTMSKTDRASTGRYILGSGVELN